jgi:nucleotide-binding universal stress UspA family protein
MILIAYDGSDDAKAAIERGGQLLPGQQATVLTIWEELVDVLARTGSVFALGEVDYESVDKQSEEQARERAQEGAKYAEQAGLKTAIEVRPRGDSVAGAILGAADDLKADAILMGTRGLTRFKSVVLGSVSNAVLQHADRPIIVVPSPEVAAERLARRS